MYNQRMIQQTLVLIKPDGVKRNLIGEIISRFEKGGLKVIDMKMLVADAVRLEKHYPSDEEYLRSLGEKSKAAGDDIPDVLEQGKKIVAALRKFMSSGPLLAMILEGEEAIALVRKITGYTDPSKADPGTIRGDLGEDSILSANSEGRPVYNLIHASGNPEEAEKEIEIWFE